MTVIRNITTNDRVIIRGIAYRGFETNTVGHILVRVDDPEMTQDFTHEAFDAETRHPGYAYDRGWFSPGRAKARLLGGVDSILSLRPHEQSTILFRLEFCKRFLARERDGSASRSDSSLKQVLREIHAEVALLDVARLSPPSKGAATGATRAGTKRVVRDRPGPKAFRKWMRRWENAAYDPLALRKQTHRSGNRDPKLPVTILLLIRQVACRYATEKRPTKKALHKDLKGEVKALNEARAERGLPELPCPGYTTFSGAIESLDKFYVMAGRDGMAKATAHFAMVGSGQDVVRPLQRVEMDEWKVSLIKLLTDFGWWGHLTEEEREALRKTRWWLCVAIDVATKVILGASLRPTACSDNALACLRMAVTDKGAYADDVGALSPWDMCGTLEELATDAGSSFIAERFQAAVVAMGTTPDIPPSGLAHLRGTVERSFLTARLQLVSRFTGQTFANVGEKGDYDPVARASAGVDVFGRALIRYWVDAYHNTPHEGLGGETPLNAWRRLTKSVGVTPSPDGNKLRAIFGMPLRRVMGKRGVRVLGLHYQSERLQEYRRKVGDAEVDVRVDPGCLGAVSVRIGEAWLTVPCVREEFRGVSAETWLATLKDLRRRYRDEAKLTLPVVLAAMRDIEAMSDTAAKKVRLDARPPNEEELDRAERHLALGFSMPDSEGAEAGSTSTGLFDDAVDTGGEDPVPQTPVPTAPVPPKRRRRGWEA
jgi:putative transposase